MSRRGENIYKRKDGRWEGRYKKTGSIQGIAKYGYVYGKTYGILHMCYVDYPVDFFVQSSIVASLIKEKCAPLLVDNNIRMPISITTKDAPAWMIVSDNTNSTALQAFSHAVMFSVLSACPVSKLAFSIVDPENRGNSVSPYFDAKKKLPELFGEQIIISRDDILTKINKLNAKIEDILQDKLGTRYETIYDYAAENDSYDVNSEMLVLYDFPNNVVNSYMVSAALNRNVTMYCIDGDSLVGDDMSGDFYRALQQYTDLHIAESRADIVQFIHDIFEVYNARKKSNEKGIIFVVIKNLQFLDIVKSMLKGETVEESEYIEVEGASFSDNAEDEFNPFASALSFNVGRSGGFADTTASNEKLLRLIEDGSGFGIHFVVSSLEYQTVKDCMHYGENALSKFPERIIFSLSDTDADNLVENHYCLGVLTQGNFPEGYGNALNQRHENAEPAVKKVFDAFAGNLLVRDTNYPPGGIPHYAPHGTQSHPRGVYFNAASDMNDPRGAGRAYYHELAHMIDHAATEFQGNLSNSPEFASALMHDGQQILAGYNALPANRQAAFLQRLYQPSWHSMSDILEATTGGQLHGRYGHTAEYWAHPGNLQAEAFAHFFEASMGNYDKMSMLANFFPTAFGIFSTMIESIQPTGYARTRVLER